MGCHFLARLVFAFKGTGHKEGKQGVWEVIKGELNNFFLLLNYIRNVRGFIFFPVFFGKTQKSHLFGF